MKGGSFGGRSLGSPYGGGYGSGGEVVDMVAEGFKKSEKDYSSCRREGEELSGKLQVTLRQSSQVR